MKSRNIACSQNMSKNQLLNLITTSKLTLIIKEFIIKLSKKVVRIYIFYNYCHSPSKSKD